MTRFGSLEFAGVVLVSLNALYMGLVAFGNITDYPSNQAFVQHVLAMDTTNFGAPPGTALDPAIMWRAVTSPVLQTIAYVAVIIWETASALVLVAAVVGWFRGDPRTKAVATVGLLMIVLLFTGGFIAIGGEWFQMYRSTAWNGLDPAFRNSVLAILTVIVVHLTARKS